jgi:hypothetical protein
MRWYHYILLGLKFIFLTEFALIMYNKSYVPRELYIGTEVSFKLLLALYIQWIVFFTLGKYVEVEDKICITFASGLLAYDAVFNDLPKLLALYGIDFSPLT